MAIFTYAYTMEGGNYPPIIHELPVAGSQTIVAGDALVMSSGQVAKAGNGAGRIVGVAAQDSTSATAGTLIQVQIAQPHHVWKGTATANATSNVRDGTRTYDLNSSMEVNLSDTTGGSLQITAVDANSNTTVFVQFTACVYG